MRSASNCLLAKDDVGRGKPSTRILPSNEHYYGMMNKPDAVDVRGLTSQWQTYQYKPKQTPNDKNYKLLNRLATKNRVTTASSQYRFRQSFADMRIQDPASQGKYHQSRLLQGLQQRRYQEESDIQFAYGKPNRPSTPIRTVVNGVYGQVASFEHTTRSRCIESEKRLERMTKPSRGHTRATTMASDQVLRNTLTAGVQKQDSAKDLFKLNKFRNVGSRVSKFHVNDPKATHRSRQSAVNAHNTMPAFQTR